MDIGIIILILSFILSLITAYYFASSFKGDIIKLQTGRNLYKIISALIIFVSLYLFYLLLTHKFQYSYVYRYSSRSLPLGYLISAFWAGQEGSYLLWTLFINILGFFVIKRSESFESIAMTVVLLVKSFLLLLMIDKSPFELLPNFPPDGAGLNPLLQDPWMVVHPPILFLGYAAATFPFAFTISALLQNNYVGWIKPALKWTLISSFSLGAGIIIGGFWAYEVLGWGGFWGWDPVENASLVPWLLMLAMLHGILVQKRNNTLVRFNLSLTILTFILVIYATFLTRSGVLANFSVHSFAGEGQNSFLIGFITFVLIVSAIFLIRRFKKIESASFDPFKINRESGLFWSMIVLLLSAVFIFIGTSSPIITGFFLSSPTPVDVSFYNRVNFPLGILISLLLGITPLLLWGNSKTESFRKSIIIFSSLAVIFMVIAYFLGVDQIKLLIFILATSFSVLTNFWLLIKNLKVSIWNIGGPLAHFGVAIMFIGIIISGNFDKTKQIQLEQNVPKQTDLYTLIYQGATENPSGKTEILIDIQKGDKIFKKKPKLYFSSYNNAWMREPDITIFPLYDIYIAVMDRSVADNHDHANLILRKGEGKEFKGYMVTFQGFEFENHGMSENVQIAANLRINYEGKEYIIKPAIMYHQNQKISNPVELPESHGVKSVSLTDINADEKMIALAFSGFESNPHAQAKELVLVELTIKPFMNFVWAGALLLILGSILAYLRRVKENNLSNISSNA